MIIGNRDCSFDSKNKAGKMATRAKASGTSIVRHVKIRCDANPFDLGWNTYFEDRIRADMKLNAGNRKRLVELWLQQNRNCQSCGKAMSNW